MMADIQIDQDSDDAPRRPRRLGQGISGDG